MCLWLAIWHCGHASSHRRHRAGAERCPGLFGIGNCIHQPFEPIFAVCIILLPSYLRLSGFNFCILKSKKVPPHLRWHLPACGRASCHRRRHAGAAQRSDRWTSGGGNWGTLETGWGRCCPFYRLRPRGRTDFFSSEYSPNGFSLKLKVYQSSDLTLRSFFHWGNQEATLGMGQEATLLDCSFFSID